MVVCSKIYCTVVCPKIYYRYFDLEIYDGVLRLENAWIAGTAPAWIAGFFSYNARASRAIVRLWYAIGFKLSIEFYNQWFSQILGFFGLHYIHRCSKHG